jgi:hypothetical protein
MKGKVIEASTKGAGNPNYFKIEGENQKIYFAHLGDIEANEQKLYGRGTETVYLKKDDEVEFEPVESVDPRAIHIKQIKE